MHTLTVNTTHFSDWGAFAEFFLLADKEKLKAGESAELKLVGYYDDLHEAPDAEKREVALTQQKVLQDPANIKNWRVIGGGMITEKGSEATYSAPYASMTDQTTVAVEVYNFIPPKFQPRKGATGKAIILKTLSIEGDVFQAVLDGISYKYCQATLLSNRQGMTLSANINTPDGTVRPFHVIFADTRFKAGQFYPYSDLPMRGKAITHFTTGLLC